MIEVDGRDAMPFRPLQGERICPVADDADDSGRKSAGFAGVDDRLQVRAAAGDQDPYVHCS